MTNTNVPVVIGIVPPTWAHTVHFDPQAIPNVTVFLFVYAFGWVSCLLRNLLLTNLKFVGEDNLIGPRLSLFSKWFLVSLSSS